MDGKRVGYWQRAGWFVSGAAIVAVCLLYRMIVPTGSASAAPKAPQGKVQRTNATEPVKRPAEASKQPAAAAPKKPPVAALVNNESITREDLARECLLHYGSEVLESMVNRTLILTSCQERNITISDKQIDEEIDRMVRKFSQTKEQWLKMLEKERGIKPIRYAQDIIWPTLALRELAKGKLTVSKKELEEAFESEFGPAVKVRLIALENADDARRVHAEAMAKPEEFGSLAKKHSRDPNSASAYGLIQPIRRYMGDPKIEAAAFALKKGQISPIVKAGNLHVFVKCEEHMPPTPNVDRAKVEGLLVDAIKDRKLRSAATDIFKDLQDEATIENIYNDAAKSKQMPGVAATINGQKISMLELAEECIERHGNDVLEGTINRRLLDQALKKRNLKVGDEDVQQEVGRAAASMGQLKPDGTPDVENWIANVLKHEKITEAVYVRDEVWPSVALKKLVGDNVKITEDDLKKGYQANYGPKVRCRAIVLNNFRRAQEVWQKARDACEKKPSEAAKAFGDLAEQYSVEANSRSLRGEVPPIQSYGGQPELEKEAFRLSKEDPLSGIVQISDTYVILFYEGRTESIGASYEEVKDMLYRDIHEKKLRIAMAKTFEQLKENARVDNYLANDFKLPKKEERELLKSPENLPQPRVMKKAAR